MLPAMPRPGRPPKEPDLSTYAGRFAARLRSLREAAGLSVAEARGKLAEGGVDVSEYTVRSWERAETAPPVATLPILAAAYGVAPGDVLPVE